MVEAFDAEGNPLENILSQEEVEEKLETAKTEAEEVKKTEIETIQEEHKGAVKTLEEKVTDFGSFRKLPKSNSHQASHVIFFCAKEGNFEKIIIGERSNCSRSLRIWSQGCVWLSRHTIDRNFGKSR